jgi:hypothetical protein
MVLSARRHRIVSLACLVAALLPVVPASAQRPAPPRARPGADSIAVRFALDQLMSPEERRAAGLDRLSPAQRRALERWLARYTAAVAHTARVLARDGRPAEPARRATPAEQMAQAITPAARVYSAWACYLPTGAPLARSSGGGARVTLADGTRWEIALADQPRADGWRPGDFIIVERTGISSDEDFRYQLMNAESRWRAAARFLGTQRARSPSPD